MKGFTPDTTILLSCANTLKALYFITRSIKFETEECSNSTEYSVENMKNPETCEYFNNLLSAKLYTDPYATTMLKDMHSHFNNIKDIVNE